MKSPLVSVIITCYNYADYVGGAIESVLTQTYKNIGLIIIDDGSTDNSLEVIKRYDNNKKVKIVSRKNKGIVFTRNEALAMAKGEFICFLDADDYFNRDYVENMVAIAQKNGADVTYPNWRIFGDNEYINTFPEFDVQKLIRQEIHCTSESLIRLSSVGDHRFESEEVAEDWDFFLGMALDGRRFKLAKDCYINYRVRKNTRGTARPYWDDMYHFYNILRKWSKKYPDIVKPVDIAVYAGRLRDDHIKSQDRHIVAQGKIIEEKDLHINKLNDELNELRSSYAYKTGRLILAPFRVSKTIKNELVHKTRKISKADILNGLSETKVERTYKEIQINQFNFDRSKKTTLAVIVHLFYIESWSLFVKKLANLDKCKFDLFVTMPEKNKHFAGEIMAVYPEVHIIIVPNRGRDVLPFIKIAKIIHEKGYEFILKIHSKKSTHRSDGREWMEDMLNNLLPNDSRVIDNVIEKLQAKNTGLVGPAGFYYPLTVNFPANGIHMMDIVKKFYSKKIAHKFLQSNRNDYGFFGGSMFWARLDAINNLLDFHAGSFEKESGQIDGTFSHALERLFTVVPEIENRVIYETDGKNVIKRPYKSTNIPDWSTDHLK